MQSNGPLTSFQLDPCPAPAFLPPGTKARHEANWKHPHPAAPAPGHWAPVKVSPAPTRSSFAPAPRQALPIRQTRLESELGGGEGNGVAVS